MRRGPVIERIAIASMAIASMAIVSMAIVSVGKHIPGVIPRGGD